MNTRETGADGTYPAYRNWEDQNHMVDLAKRWNVPVELLGKKPVSAPEIFELCEKGYIKVLWNIGTNPAVSMMNRSTHLRDAQRRLPHRAGLLRRYRDGAARRRRAAGGDVGREDRLHDQRRAAVHAAAEGGRAAGRGARRPRHLSRLRAAACTCATGRRAAHSLHGSGGCVRRMARDLARMHPGLLGHDLREARRARRDSVAVQRRHIRTAPCASTRRPHFPTEWRISESYEKDLETGHEHTLDEYRDEARSARPRSAGRGRVSAAARDDGRASFR